MGAAGSEAGEGKKRSPRQSAGLPFSLGETHIPEVIPDSVLKLDIPMI